MALSAYEVKQDPVSTYELQNSDQVPLKKTGGNLVFETFEKIYNAIKTKIAGDITSATSNTLTAAVDARVKSDTQGVITNGDNKDLPVSSVAVKTELDKKQNTLVSGTNIKTLHSKSLLGDGDLTLTPGDLGAMAASVTHLSGDVPVTRKINNYELNEDVTLNASDVGAIADTVTHLSGDVPTTTTVNGKTLDGNIVLGVADIEGAVPDTRKINNHSLSADVTLDASDVGAFASIEGGTAGQVLTKNESGYEWRNLPDVTEFDYNVVSELPATGEKGIIYLVPIPSEDTDEDEEDNSYKEYIWVAEKFELLGIISGKVAGVISLTRAQYDALEGNYKRDAIYVITDEDVPSVETKIIKLTKAEYDALGDNYERDAIYITTDENASSIQVDQTLDGTTNNPISNSAVYGALTNVETIKKIDINTDNELSSWLQNHPYKQALLYLQYNSAILGLTAGEFECFCSRDSNICKGIYTETYVKGNRYYIEFQVSPFGLRSKEQIALKSDLPMAHVGDRTVSEFLDVMKDLASSLGSVFKVGNFYDTTLDQWANYNCFLWKPSENRWIGSVDIHYCGSSKMLRERIDGAAWVEQIISN